jgi:PhnB protein
MYIPEGYGTVFPYMIVKDAKQLVAFLGEVFGAEVVGTSVMPDGRVANTRLRIGTSVFMIGEAASDGMQAMPGSYYVYVEDVDKAFASALACDATEVFGPTDMPYKDRQAGIVDPAGNAWWISRRLVEEPYDA